MAFAPRSDKPRRSPYHAGSLTCGTPHSKAKVSLSFDKVQQTRGATFDDASSVQSSCGSDSRSKLRPPGTAWNTDALSSVNSAYAGHHDNPQTAPSAFVNSTYQVQDNNNIFQPAGLVTPASKEGHRSVLQLQGLEQSPESDVSQDSLARPPKQQPSQAVQLSPAVCKSLNEVAAQLWIIAYHQKYTPQCSKIKSPDMETVQQLTQAAVVHIIKTGVTARTQSKSESQPQSSPIWKKILVTCLTSLLMVALGVLYTLVMAAMASYPHGRFS